MIRAAGTVLFLVALCPAPPSSAAEMTAQRPTFHLGDSFTYAERFETVACRTWRVTQVDETGNMLALRCGETVALLTPDGGITRIVTDKGKELVAFRIECTDRWSVAFLSGSDTSTLWYAPDARSVVKADNPSATDWSLRMTDYSFIPP
jgi:hypothetical protein